MSILSWCHFGAVHTLAASQGRAQPLGGIRASATGSAIERGLVQPGFFRLRCRVFLGFAPSPEASSVFRG